MPRPRARFRLAVTAVPVVAALLAAGGCAKMNAALGQQWIVVQFQPNTTVATAREVTSACAHFPHLRLAPVQRVSPHEDIVESARYNATYASDADTARLQRCLQRFSSKITGITLNTPGDN